jgi:hypothetical protein
MWNESFLFVFGAFVSVAMWIVISKERRNLKTSKYLRLFLVIGASTVLLVHFLYYLGISGLVYPGVGALLALVIGGVVGSFSAKFVGSLFGARFGATDPLIGVAALLILVVVYSLPTYHQQLSGLLGHLGQASIKTPILELGFTARPALQSAVISANRPTGQAPSAIARPSDPRPGLDALLHEVSDKNVETDVLSRDDRYITYFKGEFDSRTSPDTGVLEDQVISATRDFLRPIKRVAGCLRAYVDIFPDSELLLVDIKPLIQVLFRFNASASSALRSDKTQKDVTIDAKSMEADLSTVQLNVFKALGLLNPSEPENELIRRLKVGLGATEQAELLKKLKDNLGVTRDRIETFRDTCLEKDSVSAEGSAQQLSYFQPYVTIALANLLVAHGSPDEAVEVLTAWLDMWKCARGLPSCKKKINVSPEITNNAVSMPEWFGVRAEFYLNVLLYRLGGEANITYRYFLEEHAKHFADYAMNGEARRAHAAQPYISIEGELRACQHLNHNAAPDKAFPVSSHSCARRNRYWSR